MNAGDVCLTYYQFENSQTRLEQDLIDCRKSKTEPITYQLRIEG